jgi:hypothetical protein
VVEEDDFFLEDIIDKESVDLVEIDHVTANYTA